MARLALARRIGWSPAVRPDEELIADALGGQTEAFSELASRHRQRVERLCQRFFSHQEIARDLAQEAFLKAFAALASYRAEMPFGAWLRAIVTNVCYDELRRRKRGPEELVSEAEQRRESHDLAHRLLDTLKPEDRMVLVLKDSEDLGVAEIAETMGWR